MARKLRIAVSVFFGLLTVALCALWVRSYWLSETIAFPMGGRGYHAWTADGCLSLLRSVAPPDAIPQSFTTTSVPLTEPISRVLEGVCGADGFYLWADSNHSTVVMPYWFMFGVSLMSAIGPWYVTRFSLRTLLIATTLVAVVLDLGAWLAR
jgi:hypothetical protein